MAVLKKLLDLLDDLKEENPELSNRALLAAETLKAGLSSDEPSEEPEEERDDSYILLNEQDSSRILEAKKKLDAILYKFGVVMRDQEVLKNNYLEKIEEFRESKESIIDECEERYKCDPEAKYVLKTSEDNNKILVFVKEGD